MRPCRLETTGRWLIVAASIIGVDAAAVHWVVTAKSGITGGIGGGPLTAHWTYYDRYDGSMVVIVRNNVTRRTTGPTVVRPPTTAGLCRVWWPAVAAGLLTLLALAIASARRGRRFIAAFPLPQMSTRRWMMTVAVIGTEVGLVITTLRYSDIDPLRTRWTPILSSLVGLHAVAFLPAGIAALHRLVRIRRSRHDPEAAMDEL